MKGETVLCFAPRRWHSLWRETQQIMSRLAEDNDVFYIEPGRDVHAPMFREFFRSSGNLFSLNTQRITRHLTVIGGPPQIPFGMKYFPDRIISHTLPFSVKLSNYFLLKMGQAIVKHFRLPSLILWLQSPYAAGLIGGFREKLVCYHNYDEFSITAPKAVDTVWRYERRLVRRSDLVFTTSSLQLERRLPINPRCYLIPNGVDFSLFNSALDPTLPADPIVAPFNGNVIGFAGWLGAHIDIELLTMVAAAYPQYQLVLVGPDHLPEGPEKRALCSLPNVLFVGAKPRSTLPSFLKAFKVALMPWLLSRTSHAYPLKLHEYLAAGRSIVAINLPELRPFERVLRIGRTREDFVRLVGDAMATEDDEAYLAERLAIAQENTWETRVTAIRQRIDEALENYADQSSAARHLAEYVQ